MTEVTEREDVLSFSMAMSRVLQELVWRGPPGKQTYMGMPPGKKEQAKAKRWRDNYAVLPQIIFDFNPPALYHEIFKERQVKGIWPFNTKEGRKMIAEEGIFKVNEPWRRIEVVNGFLYRLPGARPNNAPGLQTEFMDALLKLIKMRLDDRTVPDLELKSPYPDVPDKEYRTSVLAWITDGKEPKNFSVGNKYGWSDAVCGGCGKSGDSLTFCAGCKKRRYCSKACQKIDWKDHKPICKATKADSNPEPQPGGKTADSDESLNNALNHMAMNDTNSSQTIDGTPTETTPEMRYTIAAACVYQDVMKDRYAEKRWPFDSEQRRKKTATDFFSIPWYNIILAREFIDEHPGTKEQKEEVHRQWSARYEAGDWAGKSGS